MTASRMSAGRRLGTTVVQDAPAERPRPRSRSPLVPEQSEPSLPCGGPEAALERVSHLRVAPRQSLTMPFLIAFGIMRPSRRGLGQAVKAAEEVCPDATTLQVAALRSLTEHIVVRAHNAGGGHYTCAVPLDSQRGLYLLQPATGTAAGLHKRLFAGSEQECGSSFSEPRQR